MSVSETLYTSKFSVPDPQHLLLEVCLFILSLRRPGVAPIQKSNPEDALKQAAKAP